MGSLVLISLLCLSSLQISSCRKIGLETKKTKVKPIHGHENENSSVRFDPSRVVQLSWHPRAFLYNGFLSDEECEHLISLAQRKQIKSAVNDTDTGNNTLSSGAILSRGQDEVISKIEERISAWTFLPKENGENMQILHYGINENHAPYYDYYYEKSSMANGGNRVATVLMYLSTVAHGGETVFPDSELKDTQAKDETWSDCAGTGNAVKPVKGNALLLFNLHPNATMDESSHHGSCVVLEGEKWSATKWIRMRAFNTKGHVKASLISDLECTDEDDNCGRWAANGECQKNPVYMLGTPDYYGSCRKSCGAC